VRTKKGENVPFPLGRKENRGRPRMPRTRRSSQIAVCRRLKDQSEKEGNHPGGGVGVVVSEQQASREWFQRSLEGF